MVSRSMPAEMNVLPAEDDGVVFDVLAGFPDRGILEDRAEMSEGLVHGDLVGRAEIIVAEGKVKGLAGDEGERYPDKTGPGWKGAVRFRVQGDGGGPR